MVTPAFVKRADKILRPQGVHFPFMKRKDGIPSGDGPPDIFVSNIKQILLTSLGERVMRPTFGSPLKRLIFSQTTPATADLIREAVRTPIALWEPRVSIEDIDVELKDNLIKVRISLLSPVGSGEVFLTLETS